MRRSVVDKLWQSEEMRFKHCLTTNEAVVRKLVGRPIVRVVLVITDSASILVSSGIVFDMVENISQ